MHKVMHVLDQIYFSPVLQRKFKALARLKRRRHKLGCKVVGSKRATGGGVGPSSPSSNISERMISSESPQITIKSTRQPPESESSESNGSQSSDLLTDTSNEVNQTGGKQSNRKRNKKKKHMPTEKCKTKALNRKMRIDRNLRLWLANRRIFIFRRKKVHTRTVHFTL